MTPDHDTHRVELTNIEIHFLSSCQENHGVLYYAKGQPGCSIEQIIRL